MPVKANDFFDPAIQQAEFIGRRMGGGVSEADILGNGGEKVARVRYTLAPEAVLATLERFVPHSIPWLHLDVYSWNDTDKPGRPAGGEALGLRAFFAMLAARYR